MRKSAVALIPLLIPAFVVGAIGCDDGETGASSESQEIASFLQDDHINAVLSEEWDIFDEWAYIASLYESSSQLDEDFETFYNRRKALRNRAFRNYQDILAISPPQPLQGFWDKIAEATKTFREGASSRAPGTFAAWLVRTKARQTHADAWLELKHICQEHNIPLQWSLPR